MLYNTMRFLTDSFSFVPEELEEELPKLAFRINGGVVTIPLSATPSSPAVVIKIGGLNYYAALVSTSDANASKIRINIGGNVYALRS